MNFYQASDDEDFSVRFGILCRPSPENEIYKFFSCVVYWFRRANETAINMLRSLIKNYCTWCKNINILMEVFVCVCACYLLCFHFVCLPAGRLRCVRFGSVRSFVYIRLCAVYTYMSVYVYDMYYYVLLV